MSGYSRPLLSGMPGTFNTQGWDNIPAKLVSKDDPERRQRLKFRCLNQSEQEMPDDKLPWSVISAETTGQFGSTAVGDYVVGQWFEVAIKHDGQSVRVIQSIASPSKEQGEAKKNEEWGIQTVQGKHEKNERPEKIKPSDGNVKNPKAVGVTLDAEKSLHDFGRDVVHGAAKFADRTGIGQLFDPAKGGAILNVIQKLDPSNISGAVQPAVDALSKMLQSKSTTNAMLGDIGELYGMVQGLLSQINQPGSGGGSSQLGPVQATPCTVNGTPGTFQYVNSVMVCVISDNSAANGIIS